jgi:hypothetical protein
MRNIANALPRALIPALLSAAVVLAAFPPPPAGQAQDPRLAAIRALSADVQARIATANKEAEGQSPAGFYCTEVFVNSRNGSWRAVGNYYQKIRFWHTDEPRFVAEEGRSEAAALVMIEVQEGAAIRTSYRDFLFAEGKLVFAFLHERAGDGPFEDKRYYFDGGKLFRFQLGQDIKSEAPDAAAVLREAAALQARFLALFR